MPIDENTLAARRLAQQTEQLGRASGREPWRELLHWISRGRLGRRRGWPVVPVLGTPWQDTISAERHGWRQRAAFLQGEEVFAVDYQICPRCQLGWVEMPHTDPRYQRCGLASAGLAALRRDHPRLSWHTLGGHFPDSRTFWASTGANAPGGYQQRPLCHHVTRG